MAHKKPKIKNEDKAKKFILQELKVADEMRKASKQLLGMNTARPEVLRRAKRYAKLIKSAEFHVIKNASHSILSEQAAKMIKTINVFIKKHDPN